MDWRVVCSLSIIAFTAYLIAHSLTEVTHCQVEIFIFLMTSAVFIPFDKIFDLDIETEEARNYIVFILGVHFLFVVANERMQAVGYKTNSKGRSTFWLRFPWSYFPTSFIDVFSAVIFRCDLSAKA